jgi:hypothetical protein
MVETIVSPVEVLTPGVTREWLSDNQILVYTVTSISRPVVNMWIDSLLNDIKNWPADKPFLYMGDYSHRNITITPYVKQRSAELYRVRKDIHGRVAMIVPQSIAGYMIQFTIKRRQNRIKARYEEQAFFNRASGLTWLEQLVATK